ncbi:hypothetical protein DHEL01_v210516 [Diaporthe helianthi]|uniref:F-box domain-containing protein n=1 Tax=Diaporthe helianthi TaxID=158607 RepID=A0A2P5HLI3_DIAHE|nr:hypothetical protein DHEL01_v210516 [Diaporthe helianthi]
MAEPIPSTRVPLCHLLDSLPVELRLNIYKYSFEGSRVQASLENADSLSHTSTNVLILHTSNHCNLLLTCRTIYHEALDTYWSETVLQLKSPPQVFASLRAFDHVKLLIDTYAYRLCNALPEAVKTNIKHVRGMVLPASRSAWLKKNPNLTASAMLGMFKSLATCEMTATLAHPIDGLLSHYEDLEDDERYSRFMTIWRTEPAAYLGERYGIVETDRVAFLIKGRVKYSMRLDDRGVVRLHGSARIRPLFFNMSTGVAFQDITARMEEEEGYKRATQVMK